MENYLVEITIHAGEYEKSTKTLIKSNSEVLAINYAIFSESHDPDNLDWSEPLVIDLHGEFAYRAKATLVPIEDINVLEKYIPSSEANEDDLLLSGNYSEHH